MTKQTGNSAMQAITRMISQIAPTNIPVLLTGESGTGKEFIAKQIHSLSARRDKTFTTVICASRTGGSFAAYFDGAGGRSSSKKSIGTLFLKEISELALSSQRDLLYTLSNAESTSDGGYAGPRLICSSKVQLEDEVRAGRFRAELYYRINGVSLHLPALRERKEDIAPLTELFLSRYAISLGREKPRLGANDFDVLREFPWPGNIRQLENLIKKIVVLNAPESVISELLEDSTELRSLPTGVKIQPLKMATRAAARGAERELILAALDRTRWNRKRAAAELKISYKSLLCKLKQIGPESSKI